MLSGLTQLGAPLMVATGLTMSPGFDAGAPWLLELFGGRQSARTIHFLTATLVVGFVLLHLSVIHHYFVRNKSGAWLEHLVFPLVGMAIILYVLYEMDRMAKWVGAAWLLIGVMYLLLLTFVIRKPAALEI